MCSLPIFQHIATTELLNGNLKTIGLMKKEPKVKLRPQS